MVVEQINLDICVYLIKNQEGKYFRAKGYHGYGESWVEDIKKARVNTKIGPARSVVTFFGKWKEEFGVANIIEFKLINGTILDETKRVSKALNKIKKEKIIQEKRHAEWKLNDAKESLICAQEKLNKLLL